MGNEKEDVVDKGKGKAVDPPKEDAVMKDAGKDAGKDGKKEEPKEGTL